MVSKELKHVDVILVHLLVVFKDFFGNLKNVYLLGLKLTALLNLLLKAVWLHSLHHVFGI